MSRTLFNAEMRRAHFLIVKSMKRALFNAEMRRAHFLMAKRVVHLF